MKILFLDEVAFPQKVPGFFGVGAILIDSKHYTGLKNAFNNHLSTLGWNPEVEFKGRFIFSHKGDNSISVSERIEFVNEIAHSSTAKKNAHYRFYFMYNYRGNSLDNYIILMRSIIKKLPKSLKRGDKKLISFFIDERDDIREKKLFQETNSLFADKGYLLFEHPFLVKSSNLTPGIVVVDILSYLTSWGVVNPSNYSLFYETIDDTDRKKLDEARKIVGLIKKKFIKNINA